MAYDLPNHIDKLNQLPDVIRSRLHLKVDSISYDAFNTIPSNPIADNFNLIGLL